MSTDSRFSAARTAVDTARTKHAADFVACERGREQVAATAAALDALQAEEAADVSRAARRFERQVREGRDGHLAQSAPSDEFLARQLAATRTHRAARQMLTSLEGAERGSRADLAGAEEALQAAVLAAIGEEADARAAHLEALRAQVEEAERILGAVRDVPKFRPSLTVFRALRDTVNLPVHELTPTGSWDRSWHTPVKDRDAVPIDAQQFWTDRLVALTTGTDSDQHSAAA